MKIDRERLELLKQIMATGFSVLELSLFLDTHPADQRALTLYNRYEGKLMGMKEEYQKRFGCISHNCIDECGWSWIDEPWPWEIDYEMGGK